MGIALEYAVYSGCDDMDKRLIQYGVNSNATNARQLPTLVLAGQSDAGAVAGTLLEKAPI